MRCVKLYRNKVVVNNYNIGTVNRAYVVNYYKLIQSIASYVGTSYVDIAPYLDDFQPTENFSLK